MQGVEQGKVTIMLQQMIARSAEQGRPLSDVASDMVAAGSVEPFWLELAALAFDESSSEAITGDQVLGYGKRMLHNLPHLPYLPYLPHLPHHAPH